MVEIKITKSDKPDKKYKIFIQTPTRKKTIHIGAKNMEDFTQHKDEKRRQSYVARHRPREDWQDPFTAGYWAYRLLWRLPSFTDAKKEAIKHATNILT